VDKFGAPAKSMFHVRGPYLNSEGVDERSLAGNDDGYLTIVRVNEPFHRVENRFDDVVHIDNVVSVEICDFHLNLVPDGFLVPLCLNGRLNLTFPSNPSASAGALGYRRAVQDELEWEHLMPALEC
jgi:hypothetical protein